MTTDKHRKRRIRELSEHMGTSYSTAREAFLSNPAAAESTEATPLDRPLAAFQSSATQPGPGPLGEAAERLLALPLSADQLPTEDARALEVSLFWGDTLIDVRCFAPDQVVRIGPAEDADFRVYDEGIAATFELYAKGSLAAPPGAGLTLVREEGCSRALVEACELSIEDRALLSLASTHLILRWVRPAKPVEGRRFEALDLYFTRALSATFLFHLFLLAAFWIAPINEERLSEGLFGTPPTLTKAIFTQPPRPVVPAFHPHLPASSLAQHDVRPAKPASARTHTPAGGRAQVLRAGLLDGANMAALLAGPNTAVEKALGALKGPQSGDLGGFGGPHGPGVGPGSGGPLDIGSIGGRLGNVGRGPPGSLSIGGGHKPTAIVNPQPTRISGEALSKSVIAAIVHKHENEIRYCYETGLNTQHDLAGKVAVVFTIGGTGDVSEANVGESTLGSASVESCIATKVRRWKFPEPKGGGQVFVTYPWIFKPAAGE